MFIGTCVFLRLFAFLRGILLLFAAVDLTEAVYTLVIVKEVIGVGDEGHHLHFWIITRICLAYEVGLGDGLADIALAVHGYGTDDRCLVHAAARSLGVIGDNIPSCAETVLGIGHIVDGYGLGVFFRLRRRVAAVCGIVDCAALVCGERKGEAAVVESAFHGKYGLMHRIAALGSSICLSGGAAELIELAAAVGVLSV